MIMTGWFGVPGNRRGSFVHVVNAGRSICGFRPVRASEFQWCAHGIVYSFIECKECKRRARLFLQSDRYDSQQGLFV